MADPHSYGIVTTAHWVRRRFHGRDLDDLQRYGTLDSVWATWSGFSNDVSVVDAGRPPRGTFLKASSKGSWASATGVGMIVDIRFPAATPPPVRRGLQKPRSTRARRGRVGYRVAEVAQLVS